MAPREGNPYSHRAFALCQLGKPSEALVDANKSIELNKIYVRGLCTRAYIYYKVITNYNYFRLKK